MEKYQKGIKIALLIAGVVAWLLLSAVFEQIWGLFNLPLDLFSFKLLTEWNLQYPAVLAFGIVLLSYLGVRRSQKINGFLEEVFREFSKVTWPNSKETMTSTGVIVIMVAIAAGILTFFDWIWGTLSSKFLTGIEVTKGPEGGA